MNYAIEATSLMGWWCTYHVSATFLPKDVLSTVIAGGGAGLTVAAVTVPFRNVRQFPESIFDRRRMDPNLKSQNILRLMASHAIFFTVYSGLRISIYKARDASGRETLNRDLQDCANDFVCGGIAGLCYRASALAYGKTPVESLWISQPKILAGTFLKTATTVVLFESMDYMIKTLK